MYPVLVTKAGASLLWLTPLFYPRIVVELHVGNKAEISLNYLTTLTLSFGVWIYFS